MTEVYVGGLHRGFCLSPLGISTDVQQLLREGPIPVTRQLSCTPPSQRADSHAGRHPLP